MLKIPAGQFMRKDPIGDPFANTQMEQQVTLTCAFFLSDREVSQDVFQRFIDDPDYLFYIQGPPGEVQWPGLQSMGQDRIDTIYR